MIEGDNFLKCIEWITKNFEVIRIADLNNNLFRRAWKRPPLLITFDDGLASVIDLALPVLRKYGIPAVVFVTVDWIESGRTPDIFLLEKAVWESLPLHLNINLKSKKFNFEIKTRADASKAFTRLWEILFAIRFPPLKLSATDVLINGKPWERGETSEDRYFWSPASWKELRAAAQAGLIEIGSHMISHTPLSWLSEEEKLKQLAGSQEILFKKTSLPVISCSYPHGLIDTETIRLSEGIYKWSFTNKPGRTSSLNQRCMAPRYHVPGEAPQQIIDTLRLGHIMSRIKRVFFSHRK